MLFEILTTSLMGGIALKAFSKHRGLSSNDSGKIQRIMSLSGLNVKDGKDTLTTQLVKKKKHEWGWEYRYRIPLGRSFSDYEAKLKVFEDGLNNRKKNITFNDLRQLDINKDLLLQLQKLWKTKLTEKKEIELAFDGLLIVRVYDKPLAKEVPFVQGDAWKVPVGLIRALNTFKFHDFEMVPHLVLGGATRYGKSNFINAMITSLVQGVPDHVNFYLIDLKGGVELCDYENIKQTISIAYEAHEALHTLQMAYDKMRDIQRDLKRLGKKNVQQAGIKERYFVVIDEVGELNASEAVTRDEKILKQECQTIMSQIARLGAGLGFRLVVATQYPVGDVIPRQVKQNADAKLCFRVQSGVASRVVLDAEGAESLPMVKGRAIYQTADKREILQTPLITPQIIHDTIQPHIIEKGERVEGSAITERREHTVTFEEV
ncbi:FtsK/SpoIIIE domain-containing protein [Lysinibacillus sp. G4S2]|uniref:FtsK/SpoIIIE domain-containing protein n=1 Tax=Lysinibacillus sp. G4S2 TaxID=3055859 RepID=UPI0025A1E5C8|nr:FtsK/SpoIIIE domain-containing protein [Lysinibacillus sp. G4S2]MDM5245777.1 FtsK/SpoIIIE domain-containing protein [Lysinibacillus sp. G4S2]